MLINELIIAEGKSPHKKGSAKYKKHMAAKHAAMGEGTLVTHGEHDLMRMIQSIFDKWQSNKHSEKEVAELLSALGYRIKMDGDRAEIIKEAPGDIRKAIAGIALIASLWGVNNHLAHKAYDASPQLQKLISLHQEAEAAGDEAAAENYADRIEQHKLRIDLGKGEVMGKDGRPKQVKRFDEASKENAEIHALAKKIKADVQTAQNMADMLSYELDYDSDEYWHYNDELEDLSGEIEQDLKQLKDLSPKVWQQVKHGVDTYWGRDADNPRGFGKEFTPGVDKLAGGRAVHNPKRSKSVAQGRKPANPNTKSNKAAAYRMDFSKSKASLRRPDQYDNVKSLGKKLPESADVEYPDSKQGVIDLIKNEMDPAYAAKLLVPGAKIIPDPNVDRVWGVKIGGEMAAVVYLDYPDVELAEAINVQITENMSDWLNAGVAKPIAQHILHYYQFSNKGKFTDVKKPKASEVRNGDLFVGDGGNTVIFNRRRRGYGEPFYIRVTGPNHKDTQTFSSIAKAFKGVKGPWKKLSGAGPDVAAVRDRDTGGKSVPPSDILGGNEPEYGWVHTMNKTYWPRLKPKLEAMADEIFAGLRRLPRDRRSASPYDPSVRHEALKFANAIEDIADSGFTKKKSEEFLQSLGKYSGGYGSAISNKEELNKIMSTQPGRAQFAKFMLSVAKRYLDNVNDLHDEYNGVNDSVRKLRGESVDEAIKVQDTVQDVEDKISALQELKQMFAIDGDRAMLKIINNKMRELLQKKKTMAGNTR